jgi:hypothetical protein
LLVGKLQELLLSKEEGSFCSALQNRARTDCKIPLSIVVLLMYLGNKIHFNDCRNSDYLDYSPGWPEDKLSVYKALEK